MPSNVTVRPRDGPAPQDAKSTVSKNDFKFNITAATVGVSRDVDAVQDPDKHEPVGRFEPSRGRFGDLWTLPWLVVTGGIGGDVCGESVVSGAVAAGAGSVASEDAIAASRRSIIVLAHAKGWCR